MLRKFTFDHTNINWTTNRDYNYLFVRSKGNYINELLKVRGYVYLNEIHQAFGVKWDPEWVNPCITYDYDDEIPITFDINEVCENTFEITITW